MKDFGAYRDIAFSAPGAVREVQERLLRGHVAHCGSNSPYYRRVLSKEGVDPDAVTLEGLRFLPFTRKRDFERWNDDFLAAPPESIVDIVLSSGTTGVPTRIMYTESDLCRLAYNEEKSFAACGLGPRDVVLLTCTMDRCFIAGLAYFLGLRSLGAAVVRNGLNSVESHVEILGRMRPTAIVGVPSFLKKLALHMVERGLDPGAAPPSRLICIGEPVRGPDFELLEVGDFLQRTWRAEIFSTYASSETVTSFCECGAGRGGHLHPDLGIVEIVDEEGAILSPGKTGEIVLTPLGVEGMPLLRFKTGDVGFLVDEPCACGRFTPRLGPILGRKKQMMKVRGTTVYPQAIYSVLEEIPAVTDYYLVVERESPLSDSVTVFAAVKDSSCTPGVIADRLQARLRVRPKVVLADGEAVRGRVYAADSRKPVLFNDRRRKPC